MDKITWLWPLSLGGKLDEACIRNRTGWIRSEELVLCQCAADVLEIRILASPHLMGEGYNETNNSIPYGLVPICSLIWCQYVFVPKPMTFLRCPVRCILCVIHTTHLCSLKCGLSISSNCNLSLSKYVMFRSLSPVEALLIRVPKDALQLLDLARVLHHVVEGPLRPE